MVPFDFVGSIFMSRNDNGSKPNFLFSCRRGQVTLMGWQGLVGWLGLKKKIQKFKDPLHGTRSTCLLLCMWKFLRKMAAYIVHLTARVH